MRNLILALMAFAFSSGCGHVLSKAVLKEVDKTVTFSELIGAPQAHKGKTVLVGGVIVKTVNKNEGTLLEVYHTRLDYEGRPFETDSSEGRFLALYNGLLDSEIYRKGRKVTIAGEVQGVKILPLGEIEYHYPYLLIKEIHLWEEERPYVHEPYPFSWWWHPWYDPWYDPYWPYWRHPFWRYRY